MSRSELVVLACLASAACNQVFEIEATVIDPGDRDDDGVSDAEDSCPDTQNPDQLDSDGDGLGDACDQCPGVVASSNHDEDLDRVPDACDVCPALPDFQLDTNRDGVGNLCDQPWSSRRTLFDGFASLDGAWAAPAGWRVTTSDTLVTDAPLDATDPGITRGDLMLGASWRIAVGIVANEVWGTGDHAGIVVTSEAGTRTRCQVGCSTDSTRCQLQLVIDDVVIVDAPVARNPQVRLSLTVQPAATAGAYGYLCRAGTELATTVTPVSARWTPGVLANPTLQIDNIEVLE